MSALAMWVWEGNEELKGRAEGLLFASLDEGESEEDEAELVHENNGECDKNGVEYGQQRSFYTARSVSILLLEFGSAALSACKFPMG